MRISFITRELRTSLRRNFTMALALMVSVSVSLALVGAALMLRSQVDRMKGYWYDKVQVSIFMCGPNSTAINCQGDITPEQRRAIYDQLTALAPTVEHIYYESSQEAYARFKVQFKGSALINQVEPNALPESFRVKLDTPSNFSVVDNAIATMPGVENIQDQRKLLSKFFELLLSLQTFALSIAVAMLCVTVLLVMNTVRMAAFARRRETGIMRSVGASNMSIRLPFIAEAALAAVVGGLLSSGVIIAVKHFLVDQRLAPNYTFIAFVTWDDVYQIIPWLFALGLGVTIIASSISLRRFLRG